MKKYLVFPFKLAATLVMIGIYCICLPGWHFVEWFERKRW